MISYEFVKEDLYVVFISKGFGKGAKRVGKIKKCSDGWRYFPIGSSLVGNPFPTLEECQNSLEKE